MGARLSLKLIVTSAMLAACSLLGGCSGNATSSPEDIQPLTTADGRVVDYQAVRCIYRQYTGSISTLSLQIQYLNTPDTVAFALYVDDPEPARPFLATPGESHTWNFEAAMDGAMFSRSLASTEATLGLDALPAPSTLVPGATVRLHGRLDIGAVTLSTPTLYSGAPGQPLEMAGGSIPIDCEATYQLAQTLD